MNSYVFGDLQTEGLEVVVRGGDYYLRYDAGAHQMAWREDHITPEEFERLRSGRPGEYSVIIELQRRLRAVGDDPHVQNWNPSVEP